MDSTGMCENILPMLMYKRKVVEKDLCHTDKVSE
jgi:hypothetical protein